MASVSHFYLPCRISHGKGRESSRKRSLTSLYRRSHFFAALNVPCIDKTGTNELQASLMSRTGTEVSFQKVSIPFSGRPNEETTNPSRLASVSDRRTPPPRKSDPASRRNVRRLLEQRVDRRAVAFKCNLSSSWPLSYGIEGQITNGLWNSRFRIPNPYASPPTTSSEMTTDPFQLASAECSHCFGGSERAIRLSFFSVSTHGLSSTDSDTCSPFSGRRGFGTHVLHATSNLVCPLTNDDSLFL